MKSKPPSLLLVLLEVLVPALLPALSCWAFWSLWAAPASAQGPITIYLPIIAKSPPFPYNIPAGDLVLQLADMPAGYELEEDSGPRPHPIAIDVYQNNFGNFSLLFQGTPVIDNIILIFQSARDAQTYLEQRQQAYASEPNSSTFPAPQYGQATIAYRLLNTDGLFPVTAHIILFRRGNIVSGVVTGAIPAFEDYNIVRAMAQKSVDRISQRLD